MSYSKNFLRCIPCEDLIRLGRNKDGGYVIPKRLLRESVAMISGGVFTDWSFEKDFINKSLINDFILVDRNTSIIGMTNNLYKDIKDSHINFFTKAKCLLHYFYNLPRVFIMRFILKEKFIEAFITSSNSKNSEKKSFITISNLIYKLNTKKIDKNIFLKLDIEGSEWEIIEDLLVNLKYFSGIAIEVHDLNIYGSQLDNLINKFYSKKMELVHVHPNNNGGLCEKTFLPKLLELTFMSSYYITTAEKNCEKLPPFHYNFELDKPCDPSSKEMIIN
tara:strand:+ start:1768 stop:2595 length:828 start_codon:yes stop_codon:yes gene_type:complete